MSATFDLDSLNPEQREAVLHPGGPLLIFALSSAMASFLACFAANREQRLLFPRAGLI